MGALRGPIRQLLEPGTNANVAFRATVDERVTAPLPLQHGHAFSVETHLVIAVWLASETRGDTGTRVDCDHLVSGASACRCFGIGDVEVAGQDEVDLRSGQ